MTGRHRLCAVTWFAVHPPRRGAQTRAAGILANLGEGWEVEHFSQGLQRTDLPVPRRLHHAGPRWTERRLLDPVSTAWLILAGRLGSPPVGAGSLLALLPRRRLRAALGRADAVYVSHPYQVAWVRRATPARIPLVMDSPNIEAQLYPEAGGPLRRRLARAVAAAERRAWALIDGALASTEADAEHLRAGGVPAVALVPNAADLDAVRPADAARRRAARVRLGLPTAGAVAVFVGSAHPPNVEAVDLLEGWAPRLLAAGVVPVVVGRAGDGRRPTSGLVLAGEVPDVAPWLAAADMGVCPLLRGGGSSLKVVEYLAAGLPVVSTPTGARGLGLRDGGDAVICEADDVPAALGRLAGDASARARLGAEARRTAEARFGWPSAGRRAAAALEASVLAHRQRGGTSSA